MGNCKDYMALARSCVDAGKVAGVVIGTIGAGDKSIFGYGRKRMENSSSKPCGDTLFKIGSVTKTFTALLLADMVCRAEASLEDPVASFLPASTALFEKITLLDLVTHCAGFQLFPHNLRLDDFRSADPYADYTFEHLLEFLSGFRVPVDKVGSYQYSNLGYALLGNIISSRSGYDFHALLEARIISKLGLLNTGFSAGKADAIDLAHGHDMQLTPVPSQDLGIFASAGGLFSTANDMLTYLSAYLKPDQVSIAQALRKTLTVRRSTLTGGTQVAMAWHISARDGPEIVWHNGSVSGYRSFVGFTPATGRGVVILSNGPHNLDYIGFAALTEIS